MTKRVLWGIGLAVSACAIATACGGDDSNGDAGGDASDATANDVVNDVVVKDSGTDASDATTQDVTTSDATGSDAATSDAISDAPSSDGTIISSDGGCDTVTTPWHYIVDPLNGSDATSSSGSGSAGGSPSNACAFKTITHAISVILAANNPPVAGTQILVRTTAVVSAGETFPIPVPQNTLIQGSGGKATVQPGAGKTAFSFAKASSALDSLVLDGQTQSATHAITAAAGSDTTDTVTNLTIQDFAGDAVLVSGTGGLTIADGVEIKGTGTANAKANAIHATDTGYVVVQPASTQVHVHDNSQYGVVVDGGAKVKMIGALGNTPPSTATILIEKNISGVFVQQTPGGSALCDIEGIASVSNTANGLELYGGSIVKLRGSYVLSNSIDGVLVATNPNVTVGASDVSQLDLGKANDYGKNRVQDTTSYNGTAGICLNLSVALNQNLYAAGNIFSTTIDCSTTNTDGGAFVLPQGKCLSGAKEDVGISGAQTNTVTVTQCVLK